MNKRRKIHMLNQKKKRMKFKKKRYMIYYILFSIILITTFLILSFTVFFNIEDVEIKGETIHKIEELLKIGGIKEGDNLILTNTKKAEKEILKNFNDIDCVTITKSFPETLTIDCSDCVVDFCCENDDEKFFLVSKNNKIFRLDEKIPKSAFILRVEGMNFNDLKIGSTFKLPEEEEKKFNIIKDAIKSEDIDNITKVEINKDKTYITFENRIIVEIEEIEKTNYLLNVSKYIIKNIAGKYEKSKIIYLKSKKSIHLIPIKNYWNNNSLWYFPLINHYFYSF